MELATPAAQQDDRGFYWIRDTATGDTYRMRVLPSLYPNSSYVVIDPPGDPSVNDDLGGGVDDSPSEDAAVVDTAPADAAVAGEEDPDATIVVRNPRRGSRATN